MSANFHEVWWIASPRDEPWAGLRIAHFRKTVSGRLVVMILGECDPRRIGLRIWSDVAVREGWSKVAQIAMPTSEQFAAIHVTDVDAENEQ